MRIPRSKTAAAWIAIYATMLQALLWSRHIEALYLFIGPVTWAAAVVLVLRARTTRLVRRIFSACLILLAFAIAAQFFTQWRIARLPRDWPQVLAAREENMDALLDRTVGRIVERGQQTAQIAAQRASESPRDTARLFERLAALRARSKVDAVAVFSEQGDLVAWAGEHRALVPEPVRFGIYDVTYIEQPLYSYIYFRARVRGTRWHVISAVLLSEALHGEVAEAEHENGVARTVAEIGAAFHPKTSEPAPPGAWPLVVKGDTIAFARLAPLTQGEWRAQARELAQRYEIMLAALVMLLLSVAWLRRPTPRRWLTAVPLVTTAIALAFSPLGAFGLSELFSPALFLLPLPADVPLGTLLAMLLAFAALAASVHGSERVPRMPTILLAVGALAVAIGYPGAIRLLFGPGAAAGGQSAATTDLLRGGAALWFGLQVAAVLLLGILTELALPRWNWKSPFQVTERIGSPWLLMLLGALGSSAALSLSVLLLGQTKTWVTPWFAAAWSLPFLLAAFAIAAYRGGGVRLIRWLTAGWLAASAVLPFMWIAHVDARLNAAERDLSTLGATDDAFLEYRLMQFAREAKAGAQAGENGYHLLWRSWLRSRLAEESYPARLMLWSRTGVPEVSLQWASNESSEMPIGVPTYLEPAFARVRANPDSTELMRVQAVPDVNEALIVSPDSEQILTVEVAPRRSLEQPDLPFLGANTNADTRVDLVPARESTHPERTWVPSKDGWRSEKLVHFTDGDYHAHMEVRLPRMGVRMARGLLLLTFDVFLFTLLWLIGRAARGEHLAILSGFHDWRSSFRARVTATLFFFFLIPTAVFGWVAFGALSREVTRATTMVAERSVDQAVVEFNASAVAGAVDLRDLATRIDAQVLYYYRGELARSSSPEIRELGVYGAWMPPSVFLALTRGDEDAANATTRIGGHQVLTAYRALASGVLAVPMPLESGETAVRQAELRDMILFALLVGALLSLLLSVVVGRALTGPINRLARAAAAVGSGNLRVRMPEDTGDEFGQLYASFNRMVRRLRRARVQEVRTARVLAWGEMARQVAHEIKNPLTPIKLAVQHLRRAYADHRGNFNDILEKNVEQILLEIDRLSEIARAFSRYGAPSSSTGPLEPINIEQVVHEALTLYKAGDPDVEYREDVEIGVPRALGRSGELKEVLLNLLENARTALDGKRGVITVTARERDDEIELSVSDNGPGIPSDFLPRVFEPHFSTRSAGTGLGLAIVRRLVESWGGNVVAESEVGKGTTIRVVLQRA